MGSQAAWRTKVQTQSTDIAKEIVSDVNGCNGPLNDSLKLWHFAQVNTLIESSADYIKERTEMIDHVLERLVWVAVFEVLTFVLR